MQTVLVEKNYHVGETVNGKIKRIESYGAFVALDNLNMGLIHLSKIKDEYVGNIHRHFRIGDAVTCEVIQNEGSGRYKLSTIGFSLPEYEVEDIHIEGSKELLEIHQYIHRLTHALSDHTKDKVQKLINQNGLVQFVIAMSKIGERFETDLSAWFVHEIEKEMSDSL